MLLRWNSCGVSRRAGGRARRRTVAPVACSSARAAPPRGGHRGVQRWPTRPAGTPSPRRVAWRVGAGGGGTAGSGPARTASRCGGATGRPRRRPFRPRRGAEEAAAAGGGGGRPSSPDALGLLPEVSVRPVVMKRRAQGSGVGREPRTRSASRIGCVPTTDWRQDRCARLTYERRRQCQRYLLGGVRRRSRKPPPPSVERLGPKLPLKQQ
jgi:hypothetical protein